MPISSDSLSSSSHRSSSVTSVISPPLPFRNLASASGSSAASSLACSAASTSSSGSGGNHAGNHALSTSRIRSHSR